MTTHRKFGNTLPAIITAAIALLSCDAALHGGALADDYLTPYASISASVSGSKLNIAEIDTDASAFVRLDMSGRRNSLTARQAGDVSAIDVTQFGDDNRVEAAQGGDLVYLDAKQGARRAGGSRSGPSLEVYRARDVLVTSYTSGEFGYFSATTGPVQRGHLGR